jgi:hypothetical protein
MLLPPHQKDVSGLRDLACEALDLLRSGQFEIFVKRYGYATAFERDLVDAVKADLAQALQVASGSRLLPMAPEELPVVYYEDNSTGLRAALDCEVPSLGGRSVWISFVVTGTETEQFFTLEDIFAHADPNFYSRLAAYFAASNRTFAQTFPSTLLAAAALRYLSDSLFWLVPAVIAAIEATAKAYEIWTRNDS